MSESQFYTFFTGGLGLLVAAALLIAWQLWRIRDEERDGAASALEGVAHELRINLQRFVAEISQINASEDAGPDLLLPVRHPQLDGVNASMIRANRNALAVIGNTYQELEARKMAVRAALAQKRDATYSLDDAMDATINGIATLYMWEVHRGARPSEVGRVRSWDVRDWMKGHNFSQAALPGMYLRDEVVERLRAYGLHLTPRPLTHTAAEYYAMHYDRMADPRSPFGRRRTAEEIERAEQKAAEKAARKAAKQAEKEAAKAAKVHDKDDHKSKAAVAAAPAGGKRATDASVDEDDFERAVAGDLNGESGLHNPVDEEMPEFEEEMADFGDAVPRGSRSN